MEKKNNAPIGVFDSGVGGLTVAREITRQLPRESIVYFGDTARVPYGSKSKDTIIRYSRQIVRFLQTKNVKAIVVACNTASAKAAKLLREKYTEQIIIAIEPAYKMVHDFAYEKITLVMATKGTIESEKFHRLYEKYDNHKTYLLACKGLADIIEEENEEKIKKYLKENLSEYKGKIENIVLGCTHYPLIQNQIKEVVGEVKFFNGAPNVAKHLKEVLEEKNLLNKEKSIGKINFIDSRNSKLKEERFFKYLEEV